MFSKKKPFPQKRVDQLNGLIRANPNETPLLLERAHLLLDSKNFKAITDIEAILAREPQNDLALKLKTDFYTGQEKTAQNYLQRGLTYIAREDYSSAITDLLEAVHLDPTNAQIKEAFRFATEKQNKLLPLADQEPRTATEFFKRATQYMTLECWRTALVDLENILLHNSELNSQSLLLQGYANLQLQKTNLAYAAFEKIINLGPKTSEATKEAARLYIYWIDINIASNLTPTLNMTMAILREYPRDSTALQVQQMINSKLYWLAKNTLLKHIQELKKYGFKNIAFEKDHLLISEIRFYKEKIIKNKRLHGLEENAPSKIPLFSEIRKIFATETEPAKILPKPIQASGEEPNEPADLSDAEDSQSLSFATALDGDEATSQKRGSWPSQTPRPPRLLATANSAEALQETPMSPITGRPEWSPGLFTPGTKRTVIQKTPDSIAQAPQFGLSP